MKKVDLLKDAIADADAIKKIAVENAKNALSEAFDSKVKSMLAAKLQEEAEEELEEEYEEEQDEAKKDKKEVEPEIEEKEKESDSDESFDIDAILAEMEEEEEEEADEAAKPKEEEEEEEADEAAKPKEEEEEEETDENVDLDALISELTEEEGEEEEESEEEEEKSADESTSVDEYSGLSGAEQGMLAAALGVGAPVAVALGKYLGGKIADVVKDIKAAKAKEKTKDQPSMPSSAQEELQEIRKQAKELAQKVNETNLINAKLLYLNKVLRSHNLTENQKVKVVAAFDKATSVKEAKIVYESLNGALTLKNETKKTGLKESFGFASKPVGNSTKREIISEDGQMVKRWQTLAGLNKKR